MNRDRCRPSLAQDPDLRPASQRRPGAGAVARGCVASRRIAQRLIRRTEDIVAGDPAGARLWARRANTGTFTKSKTNANAAAAASVPATTKAGKGVIAIPPTASVEAIAISAKDDTATQRLGLEPHKCRR